MLSLLLRSSSPISLEKLNLLENPSVFPSRSCSLFIYLCFFFLTPYLCIFNHSLTNFTCLKHSLSIFTFSTANCFFSINILGVIWWYHEVVNLRFIPYSHLYIQYNYSSQSLETIMILSSKCFLNLIFDLLMSFVATLFLAINPLLNSLLIIWLSLVLFFFFPLTILLHGPRGIFIKWKPEHIEALPNIALLDTKWPTFPNSSLPWAPHLLKTIHSWPFL